MIFNKKKKKKGKFFIGKENDLTNKKKSNYE